VKEINVPQPELGETLGGSTIVNMNMLETIFRARRCAIVLIGLFGCAVLGFGQQQQRHSQSVPIAQPHSPFVPNRYTLILDDAPVASRFATRDQMFSPAAVAYRQQIESKQAALVSELRSRSITVIGTVSNLINAVFVAAPRSRVGELESLPGVIAVRPMRRFKPLLNRAVALSNAPAAWTAVGGMGAAGQGIKIGILDGGIDQTHPAFQDPSLSMPQGFPLCTQGHPEDCAYTTNKVIVAKSYVRQSRRGIHAR
jgi:subtilisin family serine protease